MTEHKYDTSLGHELQTVSDLDNNKKDKKLTSLKIITKSRNNKLAIATAILLSINQQVSGIQAVIIYGG